MGLLLIYFFLAIGVSFLCSILEAVLLSISPTFAKIKSEEGASYAPALMALKKDVDKPLIAILTLNTVAHTVGSIGVGAQAEKAFGQGDYTMAIVSSVMTLLILVASEIIPKTIGATYWKSLVGFTVRALQTILWPLKITGILWVLQLFTRLISKGKKKNILSRADLSAMTEISTKEGVLKEGENRIVQNLLQLKDLTTKDIMTPRTVMLAVSEEMTVEEFYKKHAEQPFTRIPIFQENIDTISGYVIKNDILTKMINQCQDCLLKEISRPVNFVSINQGLPDLFEQLIGSTDHMAIVSNEYGGTEGLVSSGDLMETLLGIEIMDEVDQIDDLQKLARQKWEARARQMGMIK